MLLFIMSTPTDQVKAENQRGRNTEGMLAVTVTNLQHRHAPSHGPSIAIRHGLPLARQGRQTGAYKA